MDEKKIAKLARKTLRAHKSAEDLDDSLVVLMRSQFKHGDARCVARKIGVSDVYISDVLRGRRAISHKMIAGLANLEGK